MGVEIEHYETTKRNIKELGIAFAIPYREIPMAKLLTSRTAMATGRGSSIMPRVAPLTPRTSMNSGRSGGVLLMDD
jgi:hypothetical protein